ncbi:MAG: Ig-like domain-containing protein [archaeon]
MGNTYNLLFCLICLIFLAGCNLVAPQNAQVCIPPEKAEELGLINSTQPAIANIVFPDELVVGGSGDQLPPPAETELPANPATGESGSDLPKKMVMEGELVSFPNLASTDEDGDEITYTFSEPLDEKGEWKTRIGDAGEYRVRITASDGKTLTAQDILIIVQESNLPPEIDVETEITVLEGGTVIIDPIVEDPEGDEVVVSYSGWMTSSARNTTYEDAGEYNVTISASDGTNTVERNVKIIVQNVNRPPVINELGKLTVQEGESVSVSSVAVDPDGDELSVSYAEPLDENGEWQTKKGDKGSYSIDITVSDGNAEVTKVLFVDVLSSNLPPVIESIRVNSISLANRNDRETAAITTTASDPEGENITIKYSGWMTEATRTVGWEDGGEHAVTVTVSDGENEVEQDVIVSVNRAPQIII